MIFRSIALMMGFDLSMNSVKPQNGNLTQFLKTDQTLLSSVRPGDLVKGVVLEKNSKRLVVDLGRAGTGAVYWNEMQNAREIVRGLKIGDELSAKVIQVDNEEGMIELSLSQADKQKAWSELQEIKDKEEVLTVKASKFNRGGLIAEMHGLPAFLPVSQLAQEHYPKAAPEDKAKIAAALEALVGQELKVKIIDLNSRTNKLIVSERAANEISIKELAKNYEVGQVVEGIVSGVADFGAFLKFTDNPVVEGLIHVSELDWREVVNPKEVLNVDDVVKAKIIDIKDGRISLSLKALKTDPWLTASEKFKEGEVVKGLVYNFNPFGAVINLDKEIQGQIHVTEFGGVLEMKKVLTAGETYQFIVQEVKPTERRIVLKLKP